MRDSGSVPPVDGAARTHERAFLGAGTLLFLAAVAGTIRWCGPMAGGMRMPGGWTLSMTWMRMPGRTWLAADASFLGMWTTMMTAMMLPTLVPRLAGYGRALRARGGRDVGRATALAAAGYLLVWAIAGALAFPVGLALAAAEMRWPAVARAVPIAAGVVLLLAGGVQLTDWKDRQLRRCRSEPACRGSTPSLRDACRDGLRLGWHCTLCCASYMLVLFVAGVMDLRAMSLVAIAIGVERLAPRPALTARVLGAAVMAAGVAAVVRALTMA